ncbi:hypothetical protein [Streptomyces pinistramenti]|uniref:hypothetical protein n=1 Tax=Streptomyces pinistramenti TaxID=2884812 RepID=UPI001D08172C|nr:hypothetical protein [Streptomyces pinistramenti]MCB5911477.1 hypothetical protein [Streptomyces pinistramenti]
MAPRESFGLAEEFAVDGGDLKGAGAGEGSESGDRSHGDVPIGAGGEQMVELGQDQRRDDEDPTWVNANGAAAAIE